jgi:hypothetical protein
MKLLSTTLLIAATALFVQASDYKNTGYEYINTIVENHLKLKVEPNERQYRENLGQKLFENLI